MRVLLKTQPVRTTITDPRNDTSHSGNLHLEVIAFDPTEVEPGDLIPALDLYAAKASARHELTRSTASAAAASEFAPLMEFKTVVVRGNGASGDLRADAAALVGYLAGRLALGAEELPR
jgi:hypothetical protein